MCSFTSSLLYIASCQLLNPKWIAVVSLLYLLHASSFCLSLLCRPNRTLARYSLISGPDKSSDIPPPPSLSFLLLSSPPHAHSSDASEVFDRKAVFFAFPLLFPFFSSNTSASRSSAPFSSEQSTIDAQEVEEKGGGGWRRRRGEVVSSPPSLLLLSPLGPPRVPSLSRVSFPFLPSLPPSLITTVSLNIQ